MTVKNIAIIDYGLGNLHSVSHAFKTIGADAVITADTATIKNCRAIVLPGVGAFYRGIENLKAAGLFDLLLTETKKGKPFLGICLGFQLLFTRSEEHGISPGLDLIAGDVSRFSPGVKIPHMGWNQIKINPARPELRDGIFKGIPEESYFYFVHSYRVIPQDLRITAATTTYGEEFVSAITKENLYATQFHPERSGMRGLQILKNFINLI
ncbi:MAG: imidazole glycerol phosphate synthase subunit HisH [Candidatus Omnitrophica bacterium]|nr:imidazole glycerol phosphate synthase subunit HisH [Candidatus Omnitrophota bacterium]